MTIWVVKEEDHGVICYATSFKAAKQYLLDSKWVESYNDILDENYAESHTLEELYGEAWKEHFLQFDWEELDRMGFYVREKELVEEK